MTNRESDSLDNFGRFTEQALLILVSLSGGAKHGYAIIDDIEALSGQRLGAGTLYGAIARLEARGLIAALAPSGRRRPYQLTGAGERALRTRLDVLATVTGAGQKRLRENLGATGPS